MPFTTLFIFAIAASAFAQQTAVPGLRAAIALPQPNGLPVFAALAVRQVGDATCVAATETVCPDGDGCCPFGAPCGYTTTAGSVYGVCEGGCGAGAVMCTEPVSACCSAGNVCGADGTCTAGYGATATIPDVPSIVLNPPPTVSFTDTAPTSISIEEDPSQSSPDASYSLWLSSFEVSESSWWSSYSASLSSEEASAAASESELLASLSTSESASRASVSATTAASASGGGKLVVGFGEVCLLVGMAALHF